MCLAEGDAGAAASDRTGIDGREAFEESARPGSGTCWTRDGRWILRGSRGTFDPVVDVRLLMGLHWGLYRGGHFASDRNSTSTEAVYV